MSINSFNTAPYTIPPNVNVPGVANAYQEALNDRVVIAPIGVKQIGGFAFDYLGEDVVQMDNDVTDHWLEDNTAVQDHIGVRPTSVTLRGFVSELAMSESVFGLVSSALAGLGNGLSQADAFLGAYTPGVTDAMQNAISQAQSVAIQIEQAAARAAQISSFFSAPVQMNKQQKGFAQLSALRLARVVFTVYTPFQVFDNMTITSLRAVQSANSRTISDFTVTMKQLKFSNNISVAGYQANGAGRAATASQSVTNNGATAGTIGSNVRTNLTSAFRTLITP